MPIETSLPFPSPQQNMRIGWPSLAAPTGTFEQLGFADGFTTPDMWGGGQGAGSSLMVNHNGVFCAEDTDPRQRACVVPYPLQVRDENLAPGYAGAEYLRVYRLSIQLSIDGAATNATGLQFAPTATLTPRFTVNGAAAFGVLGNGAGGWEYVQSDEAAFPGNITDTVAIPVGTVPDATDWNTFVFEFINSSSSRDAIFTLTVNGIFVVSQNWVAPLALPDYTVPVNANKMTWGVISGDAVSSLFYGPLTIEMGRFTAAGLEILS